jgi:SAM-dependent methyltransferase
VYEAGVDRSIAGSVVSVLSTLYAIWEDTDAADAEINPLMVVDDGVVAADAVMNVDDDALFRHDDLAELEEESFADELERKAAEYGFDYVRLDGNVGIIGNGAGLVLITLDPVHHYAGSPANFLDVGGGAKAERIANALDMVFSDGNVDAIVFNIFGGITRGDEVARGINDALGRFETIPKPVVVRLAGTNAAEGMAILDTDLVEVEETLEDAVQRAVRNAEADNIIPVEGDARSLSDHLPDTVDVAMIANTLHGVGDPASVLREAEETLSADGRLVVINWQDRPKAATTIAGEPRGPPTDLRLSAGESRRLVRDAVDLRLTAQIEIPPYHYGLVFER